VREFLLSAARDRRCLAGDITSWPAAVVRRVSTMGGVPPTPLSVTGGGSKPLRFMGLREFRECKVVITEGLAVESVHPKTTKQKAPEVLRGFLFSKCA